jgi:rare lipoprotein A
MKKSITAYFFFSIVALVSSQSQITTNQKSIQQATIQKVAVLKDTVKKKSRSTLQEIKKDTVADKMGELVLHKKMLMPRTMRTSFMEGELQVEYHLTENKYTAAHKKTELN